MFLRALYIARASLSGRLPAYETKRPRFDMTCLFSVYIWWVRDSILPSGAKTTVKTMELPRCKFASGASTIVKTKHSRWRRKPPNGVFSCFLWICNIVTVSIAFSLKRIHHLKLLSSKYFFQTADEAFSNIQTVVSLGREEEFLEKYREELVVPYKYVVTIVQYVNLVRTLWNSVPVG